ncbi:alpha/beta family hydrolase [Halomonas sp. DQ26W]|uniref:alpha/beta family hydrolase n=1 Tax=Halomonas sp. DQ26W TaxID=2282311 RepID=UPI0026BC4A34|nr:alpha/beta family hydrolase [Halomonas sp. DQ26W]
MSYFARLDRVAISSVRLRERLLAGEVGRWRVEGLGPLEVEGDGSAGRLLIAHGAGAGQGSPFMSQLRAGLAEHGVQTLAVEFAYMQRMQKEAKRFPPPRIDRLVEELSAWCDILTHPELGGFWLGGKSMGGRAASLLAARDQAAGLILCGYPFHPPGKPESLRLSHWPLLACPTLVLQGSRDPFGNAEEIEGYRLGDNVAVHLLEDGDHDWKPRRASGLTQEGLIAQAAGAIAAFMLRHPQSH